jgi:DNA-binding CsgD family transcriptional regulator
MVGRHSELAALLEAFDDGAAGTPRTVVVRGEAGVGKTRLVQEFLSLVASPAPGGAASPAGSAVVAFGQCVDLGPIGAAFGPIRRVLRDLHAALGADALREAAGSTAAIASLAALVPGISAEQPDAEEPAGEFAEAIEVLLEQLSQRRHLVVVLEDLQWADAASMALLKTLASTLRGRRLTIVATYRSDDIDRFHPLRPVLAELDRTRSVVRVEVGPLNADEVAEQVGQLAPGLGPRLVESVSERSGGIPFLVEELVDVGDRALPETLRDLVLARYARLDDDAQHVVRTMAAGGMHVDHGVLAAVTALDETTLDAAVREAIDTRVILADGAGYTFRHALTREAVDAEILPSERVRVHRRYAEHLRSHQGDAPEDASAIAEHWLAARDLPAAFDATVEALRHTRTRFSPATRAKLAERLTELWDQVPDAATRAAATLPALHLDAAQAWHDLGDTERALRSADEGLAVCPDDTVLRAALLRQRYVESFNLDNRDRLEDIEQAVALLEHNDDKPARILLSRALTNLAQSEHGEAAAAHSARAIALAEQAGDAEALAVALTVEAWRIAGDEDDEPGAVAPLQRAVTLPVAPPLRAYAGAALTDMLLRIGRFREAAVVGTQHYDDVARAGIERGSGASIAHPLSFALFAAGRPAEAMSAARRARRLLGPRDRGSVYRLLASHYDWDDRPDERAELLAAERAAIDAAVREHPGKLRWWTIERGESLLGARGPQDLAAARELLPDVVAAAEDEDRAPAVRRYGMATAALLALGTDADAAVHARIRAAIAAAPAHDAARAYADFADAALADAEDAPAAERVDRWRAVIAAIADDLMPVWHLHQARFRLATALIAAGHRDEAPDLLARVAAEAPGQGVARVGRWASELAAQAGGGSAGPASGSVASLTPRELQVLELIAEGLTNPQIGQRLFISPKTASVHVSAILAKIGATNRTEAAALFSASL